MQLISEVDNIAVGQALIAIVLALVLDWIPKVKTWWGALAEQRKRLYMGLALFVTLLLLAIADCALGNNCPADWWSYVLALFLTYAGSVAVNQTTHGLFKPPAS